MTVNKLQETANDFRRELADLLDRYDAELDIDIKDSKEDSIVTLNAHIGNSIRNTIASGDLEFKLINHEDIRENINYSNQETK